MIRRPPRSTRTDTLSLHDALPIYTLQKLSYTGTIFVLLPLLIVSGLALSPGMDAAWPRSEEHTSELQSLMRISYAVFCLKKKMHITQPIHGSIALTLQERQHKPTY